MFGLKKSCKMFQFNRPLKSCLTQRNNVVKLNAQTFLMRQLQKDFVRLYNSCVNQTSNQSFSLKSTVQIQTQLRGLVRKYARLQGQHNPTLYLARDYVSKYIAAFAKPSDRDNDTEKIKDPRSDEEKTEGDKDQTPDQVPGAGFVVVLLIGVIVSFIITTVQEVKVTKEVTWQDFLYEMLAKGEVKEVRINLKIEGPRKEMAQIELVPGAYYKGKRVHTTQQYVMMTNGQAEEKIRKAEAELGIKPQDAISIVYEHRTYLDDFYDFLARAVLIGLLFMALRNVFRQVKVDIQGRNMFSMFGKANYKRGDQIPSVQKISFKDVAGLSEPKIEIMEFVEYLKNPEKFKKLGAKVPKGALLLGPPGCGKTLLAKAVATEANVPFFTMAGPEFVEMIGGLGASRMRNLFKDAREKAPCIIYIDEIDAIGKKRYGGNPEEEHTLNQLLVELDGMQSMEGVILLASTNRHEVLDKALLRSGRFDRHITIELPTLAERKEMYDLYLKSIKTHEDPAVYIDRLAQLSPGMSGADIKNICNEAALYAARRSKTSIDHTDFDYAMERVIVGVARKSRVLSMKELRIVAFHEAGHAVVGWLLEHTDALLKVTIKSRTNAILGFAQYAPSDRTLVSKEELFDMMCMALGGRVAEAITFNSVTSGAQDDLKRVSQMADQQIRHLGMNDDVGPLSFSSDPNSLKPYSKKLQMIMDREARMLVSTAYQATEKLLLANKDKLKLVAENLLEREVLNYNDMKALLGEPPYKGKKLILSDWTESGTISDETKPKL